VSAKRITRIKVKDFSRLKPGKTDWARLRGMREEEIDFTDAPELTEEQLAHATWTAPRTGRKVTISMRVDPEVLDWFKRHGRGYQSRMHTVLRAFVRTHEMGKTKKSTRRAA
jgi:uncharacterized protein (DUF4415 family)